MDVNRFLENASDKKAWFEMSKRHWLAGRLLSRKSFDVMPESTGKVQRLDRDWLPEYLNYAVPAHLMYGFALETAIKATIIQEKPEKVEFEVSTNCNSDIKNARLKGFSVGEKNWHNLSSLAEMAGLFEKNFANNTDREWLDGFTDEIVCNTLENLKVLIWQH